MKNLLRLTQLQPGEIYEIFHIADEIYAGKYRDALKGKSVILFFPDTSIRTRVTFEKGICLLGASLSCFPVRPWTKRRRSGMCAAI